MSRIGRKRKDAAKQQEQQDAILKHLRQGATRKDAAGAVGVTYKTLWLWTRQDGNFCNAVAQAEGECATLMSERIYHEATRRDGDWRAALEWLKRRRPSEWGDTSKINLGTLTDEQLRELLSEWTH